MLCIRSDTQFGLICQTRKSLFLLNSQIV